MILVFSMLLFVYGFLLVYLMIGIDIVKNYEPQNKKSNTTFTIIVPFRNEKNNLPILLESIKKINYPTTLFEVILVDDASDDGYIFTPNQGFKTTLLINKPQSKASKKEALTLGIEHAIFEWIITTDADCVVPELWLQTLDNFIQTTHPKMVVMPVKYLPENTFLYHFQNIEMINLQGVTKGSFGNNKLFMCNGANFAYQKKFFYFLNGFQDNLQIPSGDDVFLLQKALIKNSKSVTYLSSKAVVVETKAAQNWTYLLHQKIRWASKSKKFTDIFAKILAVVVAIANLIIILSWIAYFATQNKVFLGLIFIKYFIDILLLAKSNQFFKTKIKYLLLSTLVYPFFAFLVFLRSINGTYTWKGRVNNRLS